MEVVLKKEPKTMSNLQLELLKIYSYDVSESDLLEVKNILANYFANKMTKLADKVWQEKGYSEDYFLNQHLRK